MFIRDPDLYWLLKYSCFSLVDGLDELGDEGDKDGGGDGGDKDQDKDGGDGGDKDKQSLDDLPDEIEVKLTKEQFTAIPENFRKPDGTFLVDSLVKSWSDAQGLISKKGGDAPEDAKDYSFEPVDDEMKANAAKALAVDDEIGEDPVIHAFRDFAKEKGMSKELFQDIVGWFVNKQGSLMDDPIDRGAEDAQLGSDGPKIKGYIKSVAQTLRANGTLDDSMADELKLATHTAAGTKLVYALLGFGKETVTVPKIDETSKAKTLDEIRGKIKELNTKRAKNEIPESQANREYDELIKEMEAVVGAEQGGTSVVMTE